MPSPTERAALTRVRLASTPTLVEIYNFEVNAPVNRPEDVQAQRWVALAIHAELFRRGVDPASLGEWPVE